MFLDVSGRRRGEGDCDLQCSMIAVGKSTFAGCTGTQWTLATEKALRERDAGADGWS